MEKIFEKATFAGGCFWCMQGPFDALDGVESTVVGYTGGHTENPTYDQVSKGTTGHAEAIEVTYDPGKVSYRELLDVFWRNIDPSTENGQFADHGTQYRTAIFYHSERQKRDALESRDELLKTGKFKKIVTQIVPASVFYAAEEYHQKYYKKRFEAYEWYKKGSGREGFLKKTWGR